ncbi:MAG: 3-isopropylmalate dehydratase small subunit [Pseudomonadota bacterium]
MAGWAQLEGQALRLPRDGIDTDQLIPARFMARPRAEGYGDLLLYDLRRASDGTLDPDFPLNGAAAPILIAGRDFGTGSSREAAVYALVDAGIRAVLAPSFGDIFAGNAGNNGLLTAVLPPDVLEGLGDVLRIDLEAKTITSGAQRIPFPLDGVTQQKLINGWDDIDLTLSHTSAINAHRAQIPQWVWPRHDNQPGPVNDP